MRRVSANLDACHVGRVGDDVFALGERHLDRIGHVQIAAVPSRAEPDESDVDYAAFLAELDAVGYAGRVGCEYRPRAATDGGLKWLRALGVSL